MYNYMYMYNYKKVNIRQCVFVIRQRDIYVYGIVFMVSL